MWQGAELDAAAGRVELALDDRVPSASLMTGSDPVPHKQTWSRTNGTTQTKPPADECVRRYVGCLAGGLFGGGCGGLVLDVRACSGFVTG